MYTPHHPLSVQQICQRPPAVCAEQPSPTLGRRGLVRQEKEKTIKRTTRRQRDQFLLPRQKKTLLLGERKVEEVVRSHARDFQRDQRRGDRTRGYTETCSPSAALKRQKKAEGMRIRAEDLSDPCVHVYVHSRQLTVAMKKASNVYSGWSLSLVLSLSLSLSIRF